MTVISIADPDPGSGAFLTPVFGMGKKSRSGFGMNIPDHISESSVTILKFFEEDADPDPGIFLILDPGWKKIRFRDKHPGSGTLSVIACTN
jgi:hypothetical protein